MEEIFAKDLKMEDFLSIRQGEEEKEIQISEFFDFESGKRKGIYGRSFNIYISATEGNDDNIDWNTSSKGNTAETPIKTVEKLIEIFNSQRATEYNVMFMDSSEYEIPADIFVMIPGCPHFFAEGGSPTLHFKRAASSPRFYSGRVHLEGRNGNRLKITSDYGSIYFEHCALCARNVDFLVPTGFYCCTINIVGSSFMDNPAAANKEDSSANWYYQVYIYDCTGRIIDGTEFKGKSGVQSCLYVRNSHLRIDTTFKVNKQKIKTPKAFYFIGSTLFLDVDFKYTGSDGYKFSNMMVAENCIINAAADFFNKNNALGLKFEETPVFQNGKQVYAEDSITYIDYMTTGFVTGGGTRLHFTLDLPFNLKDSAERDGGVNIQYEKCIARGVQGYIDSSGSDGTTSYNVKYRYYKNQQNQLDCIIELPNSKKNIVNNTPVNLYFINLKLSFK